MKVIVCMTTIPSRNGTLGPTIQSLHRQSIRPDANARIYITAGVIAPKEVWFDVHGAEDIGPLTKLTAAKDLSLADDDLIVTVDDDIIYEPGWLEALVTEAEKRPDEAVGFAGWDVHRFLAAGSELIQNPAILFSLVRQPAYCDVLEGWAGVAYRRGFFDVNLFAPDPVMRKQDDVLISAYLNRNGIKRYAFRRPMCRADNRPGIHNRPDFVQICRDAVVKGFQGEVRLGTERL